MSDEPKKATHSRQRLKRDQIEDYFRKKGLTGLRLHLASGATKAVLIILDLLGI